MLVVSVISKPAFSGYKVSVSQLVKSSCSTWEYELLCCVLTQWKVMEGKIAHKCCMRIWLNVRGKWNGKTHRTAVYSQSWGSSLCLVFCWRTPPTWYSGRPGVDYVAEWLAQYLNENLEGVMQTGHPHSCRWAGKHFKISYSFVRR